jgi:ferredoxin
MNKKLIKNIQVTEIAPGIFRAISEKSRYIIEYDRNICIGAGSCAYIAALTFLMDEENRAKIRDDVADFDDDDIILAGAQSCPVFAIKIYDKETGELIFPETIPD